MGNQKAIRNTRQNQRVQKKTKNEKSLELRLIKSYPSQVVWEVTLPGTPFKQTTTVTTGVIAAALAVQTSSIAGFATRFGSTFVEYRIIKARIVMRMFSATNPGVIQAWYDEKSASNPTAAEATERYILSVNASDIEGKHQLCWTNSDPLDLQYTAIGSSVTPVTFKWYTSNSTYGSSIVATDYLEIIPYYRLQFRGLLGV